MSRHTPGPWLVCPPDRDCPSEAMVGAKDGEVAIYCAPLTGETEANARLIAAAPEMYEAIKAALKQPNDAAWDMLRAAIKKAEGK